jgi:hypothetical protein
LARKRRGAQHAGIPEGLWLQGWPAHGAGERLPGVVKEAAGKWQLANAKPAEGTRASVPLAFLSTKSIRISNGWASVVALVIHKIPAP